MSEVEAIQLFKCLADKSRLMILKFLCEEPMYVERMASRLGITAPTVSFHLKKLMEAGIVCATKDQYYTMYSINENLLTSRIIDIIKEESSEKQEVNLREEKYRKKVIESFFEYGKLKSIPVQRKKEQIILEEIAKSFEAGKRYTEREVNIIIADYNDDFCTIRRDMISFGIFAREGSEYWLK